MRVSSPRNPLRLPKGDKWIRSSSQSTVANWSMRSNMGSWFRVSRRFFWAPGDEDSSVSVQNSHCVPNSRRQDANDRSDGRMRDRRDLARTRGTVCAMMRVIRHERRVSETQGPPFLYRRALCIRQPEQLPYRLRVRRVQSTTTTTSQFVFTSFSFWLSFWLFS